MAKISPISAKYIIHADIQVDGVVDRPDVIGAIFGQTEGLLGSELELRELQRSGKIGRIEVTLDVSGGKTKGTIIIPSSLDKAETCIIAAALEIIERIGPCNARVRIQQIEDVRISKRNYVIERAKELLKQMTETVLPDSQELAEEVAYSVRVMEIREYGRDRLPAGPNIEDADEIIVVEGRADVINLLKHGIKNAIAINGTSIPQTIIDLSKRKIVTAFVDGDRGGILILKELLSVADVDYVARAPEGKEVEEITKKEIHKALRSKIAAEQARLELGIKEGNNKEKKIKPIQQNKERQIDPKLKGIFKKMLEDLIGTRAAYLLDEKLSVLGKIPVIELQSTLKSLDNVTAIVFDGTITKDIVRVAEQANTKYIVGMQTRVDPSQSKALILTVEDF